MTSNIVRELIDSLRVEKSRRLCIRTAIFLHDGLELDMDDYIGQYQDILIILTRRGFTTALEYIFDGVASYNPECIRKLFLICCEYNQINTAEWLVDKFHLSKLDFDLTSDSYPEFDGFLPLEMACYYGHPTMVEWLQEKFNLTRDDFGSHTFIDICKRGCLRLVKTAYYVYELTRDHCMKFNNAAFGALLAGTNTKLADWLQSVLIITREEFLQYNKLSLLILGKNGGSQMREWLNAKYDLTQDDYTNNERDLINRWTQE